MSSKPLQKKTLTVLAVLLALSVCSSLYFGINVYLIRKAQSEAADSYESLRTATAMASTMALPENTAVASTLSPTAANTEETGATPAPMATHTPEEIWALENVPDFVALQAVNKDIVGWIRQEGTPIDYPILYSEERGYYLTHLYDGKENKHGSIYIDPMNSPDLSDRNTMIYGHNMKDETMFGSLYRYKEQAYFDAHPTMAVYTPEHVWLVELFAINSINTSEAAPQTEIATDLDMARYASQAMDTSLVQSAVVPDSSDSLITLVTCSTRTDLRLLVLGRLKEL